MRVTASVLTLIVITESLAARSVRGRHHAGSEIAVRVLAGMRATVKVAECVTARRILTCHHARHQIVASVSSRVLTLIVIAECIAASCRNIRDHADQVTASVFTGMRTAVPVGRRLPTMLACNHARAEVALCIATCVLASIIACACGVGRPNKLCLQPRLAGLSLLGEPLVSQ